MFCICYYYLDDKDKKKLFDSTFALAMNRDLLIQYIYDNGLEEELNRRVEEKWENFLAAIDPSNRML
mgnify:CR=1 FL=1